VCWRIREVIENIAIMPPKRKLAPDNSGNLDISAMFKKSKVSFQWILELLS